MISNFNLNNSRKPEHGLQERLIHENIQMFGISVKWLFSERINVDRLVFKDFSNFKVGKDYKDVMLKPEDPSNWEGDNGFGLFGFTQNHTQIVFISRISLLDLFPDLETGTGFSTVKNSLILLPSGTVMEITSIDQFHEGINNLWAYADKPSSYKLTIKVHNINISDEGVSDIQTEISMDEGPEGSKGKGKIFEHTEEVSTGDIDDFFNSLEHTRVKQDQEGDKISDTGGVFGNLS